MKTTTQVVTFAALSLLWGGACQLATGSDAGTDAGEEAGGLEHLSEHVCTHFQTGTPQDVTAATTRDPGTDEVQIEHDVFAASLVDFEGERGGYLRLIPDAQSRIALFFNEDLPVALEDDAGVEQSIADQLAQPSTCSVIQKVVAYDLDAATYFLRLGPSAVTAVDIVAEEVE